MKACFVTPILANVARRADAQITLERACRCAGRIAFKNGTVRHFKGTSFALNPLGASEIAKDKAYATFFMRRLGYNTIEGESFLTAAWCDVNRNAGTRS